MGKKKKKRSSERERDESARRADDEAFAAGDNADSGGRGGGGDGGGHAGGQSLPRKDGFELLEEKMSDGDLRARLAAAKARMECGRSCESLAPASERAQLAEMQKQVRLVLVPPPRATPQPNGAPRTRACSVSCLVCSRVRRLSPASGVRFV